jgi:hypothetical protein
MPSVILKLKHGLGETVDVSSVEVEVNYDKAFDDGRFSFTSKEDDGDETYCFTLIR